MCKVERVRKRLCCKRHRALAKLTCLLVDIFDRFASRCENSFEQGFTMVETVFCHLPHRIHSVIRYLHGAFGVWLRELHRWTFGQLLLLRTGVTMSVIDIGPARRRTRPAAANSVRLTAAHAHGSTATDFSKSSIGTKSNLEHIFFLIWNTSYYGRLLRT